MQKACPLVMKIHKNIHYFHNKFSTFALDKIKNDEVESNKSGSCRERFLSKGTCPTTRKEFQYGECLLLQQTTTIIGATKQDCRNSFREDERPYCG